GAALGAAPGHRSRDSGYSGEAVRMARRIGDPKVLAQVLASHHAAIAGPDHEEERLSVAHELTSLGLRLADLEITFAGQIAGYVSMIAAGNLAGADAALDEADFLARELRRPAFAFHVLRTRTCQALLAGRVTEGEHLADAMHAKGREAGLPMGIVAAIHTGLRFLAHEQRGCLADLADELDR
ncbi:hypothetical protein, partial [Actinocorallia lasiicapitis]